MEAAEEAAGAGNYVSAREYLRQAVALQEASVGGPTDPFLANTLNNLGVVYEREGKPAEAEACYRRAYAVASAAFAPDHPFVVMSGRNLREFCEARGLPFDRSPASPAALPPVADRLPQPPAPVAVAPIAAPAAPDRMTLGDWPEPPTHPAADTARAEGSTSPVVPSPSMGRLVFAGLIIGALIAIVAIIMQSRSTALPPERTAAAASARADRPKPAAGGRTVPPRREAAREQLPRAEAPVKVAASAPTLAAAELCRTLQMGSDWRCAPATGTLRPGVVFFYTRLLTQTDTTVQHRWYHGSRLHQSVTLRVHANARAGYRTYSQMTVSPARAGDWRVELRAANGAVLHEERFTVSQ
jgi:Protein of unknown function (DUF2914)/Tetratricopeptide repeat